MTEPSDRTASAAALAAAAKAVLSVENAPLPLLVCHPDGRVALANRAMRALLGYQDGEIVNRRVWELRLRSDQHVHEDEHQRVGRAPASAVTPHEVELLELAALGFNNQAIADRLILSLNTVRSQFQKLLKKLGAHSKLEAVAIARRRLLIR